VVIPVLPYGCCRRHSVAGDNRTVVIRTLTGAVRTLTGAGDLVWTWGNQGKGGGVAGLGQLIPL